MTPSSIGQQLPLIPMWKHESPAPFAECALHRLLFVGLALGLQLGLPLGDTDGIDDGLALGETLGLPVGASELSQQERYVPPGVGQHGPLVSPAAKHRGCAEHSLAGEGDALGVCVGLAVGLLLQQ